MTHAEPKNGFPQPFGRYQLLEKIGQGGMAEVFRAVAPGAEGFERVVVVKRILPEMSQDKSFVQMFVDEAKISALISHPNVVQVHEFGTCDDSHYLVMEYVHGSNLSAMMQKLSKLGCVPPADVVAEITRQACLGLHHAHVMTGSQGEPLGIVHRDVTPANLIVGFNGAVKVLDFGIARAAEEIKETRTQAGAVKGKVSYLAPELINRQPATPVSDVFGLGIVLYECLTGQRLFKADNPLAIMKAILDMPIEAPSGVNADVPPSLDAVALKALARDTKQRYQSARAMAADLETVLHEMGYRSDRLPSFARGLFEEEQQSRKDHLSQAEREAVLRRTHTPQPRFAPEGPPSTSELLSVSLADVGANLLPGAAPAAPPHPDAQPAEGVSGSRNDPVGPARGRVLAASASSVAPNESHTGSFPPRIPEQVSTVAASTSAAPSVVPSLAGATAGLQPTPTVAKANESVPFDIGPAASKPADNPATPAAPKPARQGQTPGHFPRESNDNRSVGSPIGAADAQASVTPVGARNRHLHSAKTPPGIAQESMSGAAPNEAAPLSPHGSRSFPNKQRQQPQQPQIPVQKLELAPRPKGRPLPPAPVFAHPARGSRRHAHSSGASGLRTVLIVLLALSAGGYVVRTWFWAPPDRGQAEGAWPPSTEANSDTRAAASLRPSSDSWNALTSPDPLNGSPSGSLAGSGQRLGSGSAQKTVRIAVDSAPQGAQVFGPDRTLLGQTPLSTPLPKGATSVALTVEKRGFQPRTLYLIPDEDKPAFARLKPLTVAERPSPKPPRTNKAPHQP